MRARHVLIWVVAIGISVLIALATKIGPIVVSWPHSSHGLHVGDIVGAVVCLGAAALLTAGRPRR